MGDDRLKDLTARFRQLGLADDSAVAAAAELGEDSPVLATEVLLRLCWRRLIDSYDRPGAFTALPSARRLADAGASVEDLRLFARGVAFETIFGLPISLTRVPASRFASIWG